MRDSFLVNGVAFKKTFSYAGFEQQPKKFLNPKILLLNIELELNSEKENAEIRYPYRFTQAPSAIEQNVFSVLYLCCFIFFSMVAYIGFIISIIPVDCLTLCNTNQLLMLSGTLFMTNWINV